MLIIAVIIFCLIYGVPYVTSFQVTLINLLSDVLLRIIDFTAKHLAFLFFEISDEIFGSVNVCRFYA